MSRQGRGSSEPQAHYCLAKVVEEEGGGTVSSPASCLGEEIREEEAKRKSIANNCLCVIMWRSKKENHYWIRFSLPIMSMNVC